MEILQFLVNNTLFLSFCSAFGVVAGMLVAVVCVVALFFLGVLFLGVATALFFFHSWIPKENLLGIQPELGRL